MKTAIIHSCFLVKLPLDGDVIPEAQWRKQFEVLLGISTQP